MDIVKLKKISTETQNIVLTATRLTEKQLTKTEEELQKYVQEVAKNEFFSNYDSIILFIGELDKYPHYNKAVFKYKKKGFGGTPVYRNYCVSIEDQEKTRLFVNVAEDAETSWNTVKSALGAQTIHHPCYGIVVRFEETKVVPEFLHRIKETYYDK